MSLSILSSVLVGGILAIAPWTTLWESNYLLQPWPLARSLVLHPLARGIVTGLGLVNIVLAVYDAWQHLTTRDRD